MVRGLRSASGCPITGLMSHQATKKGKVADIHRNSGLTNGGLSRVYTNMYTNIQCQAGFKSIYLTQHN